MNLKTRNKESQINTVYLIYVFCVVLSSLLAEVSHGDLCIPAGKRLSSHHYENTMHFLVFDSWCLFHFGRLGICT